MKKTSLFVLAFLTAYMLPGQSAQTLKLLPTLIPPSPEAAGIARFGNYEVSEFTGVPNISIPLYTVKVGDLTVPVSINYHASGNKVTDIPSRVGLGWSLEAGGTITRKIEERPDELPGYNGTSYFNATPTSEGRVKTPAEINPAADSSLTYLYRVDHGTYDVQPDIFSYSFPGHSGKFLFNQKDNFKPFVIPFSPIAITKTQATTNTVIFSIKDEGGNKYDFNTSEWSSTGGGIPLNATSAWMLSDMISANTQDTINFKYSTRTGGGINDEYFSDFVTFDDAISGQHYNYNTPVYGSDQGSVATWWQQLDEIDFRNGKIVFESAPEARTDFSGRYQLQKRINRIKIFSYDAQANTYALIKTIQFFHSYFRNGTDNATARLKLDSMQVLSSSNIVVETYKFDYNTAVSLPDNKSRMKDYWGYFNNIQNKNSDNLETLIPQMVVPYNVPPSAPGTIQIGGNHSNARDPDPAYMQAGILQKITFPTGGYTQFEYETNKYLDDQNNPKYAGGLRIKSIKSYEKSGATPLIKTYKYGDSESGYGRANFSLETYFFSSHQPCRYVDMLLDPIGMCQPYSYKTINTYFSNPTNDIEGYDGSPVVYSTVTEYTGDSLINKGKTVYKFNDKTDAPTSIIGYGKALFDSYHFVRGLPTNKLIYKNDGTNNYVLLSEKRAGYKFFDYQWSAGGIGLSVSKKINDEGTGTGDGDIGEESRNSCFVYSDNYNYNYNNYNIVSGDNKLVADTSILYDQINPGKAIVSITNYTYDDLTHLNLTQVQTVNSKGDILKTTFTYPYNYSTSPYTTMNTNHIWDKQITETKFNSTTQLTKQTNNYASFASNNYLPQSISMQVKNNPVDTRALFNQYDSRGNILEMQKSLDATQSIIWDYSGIYPIAQINNAAQANIAYTSFEADGTGNWTIGGTSRILTEAITGKKCYKLTDGAISKSGLTSSIIYIVSYWIKDSFPLAITGTQGTALKGKTSNGWTYFEHQVTGVSQVSLPTVYKSIDELRLYPKGAQMSSYTYDPLVGITSQCDINNDITYYEYDAAGRLQLVRDQNKYVLKKYCYNYAGQPGSCSVTPASVALTSINYIGSGYIATYTNINTDAVYTFNISSSYMSAQPLGTVPAGNYTLTISNPGNSQTRTFGSGCQSTNGTSATFSNVFVSPATCNQVYLSNPL